MNLAEIVQFFAAITPGGVGIWTIVLMVGAYLIREWRETRKLSSGDALARRLGFAAQVESLQEENRNLRNDISKDREQHDQYRRTSQAENDKYRSDCRAENDHLRAMLDAVQSELAGYKRHIDTLSLVVAKQSAVHEN